MMFTPSPQKRQIDETVRHIFGACRGRWGVFSAV